MFDARYIVETLRILSEQNPKQEANQLVSLAMMLLQVNDISELAARLNGAFPDGFANFIPYTELAAWAVEKSPPGLKDHLQSMILIHKQTYTVDTMIAACSLSLLIQAMKLFSDTFTNHLVKSVFDEAILFLS